MNWLELWRRWQITSLELPNLSVSPAPYTPQLPIRQTTTTAVSPPNGFSPACVRVRTRTFPTTRPQRDAPFSKSTKHAILGADAPPHAHEPIFEDQLSNSSQIIDAYRLFPVIGHEGPRVCAPRSLLLRFMFAEFPLRSTTG